MVRSWIRQALRASGVAILVPAAVAAAIALSVIGGGHDVASLGEVLRGPAIPPAEATGLRGRTPQSDVQLRGQTPQLQPRRRTAELQRHMAAAPPERPSHPPLRPEPRPPAPAAPSAPAPAPIAPPPAPAPQPRPHPIHDTGTTVAETLRPLPLAGPAAADAVEAVVSLVDPA